MKKKLMITWILSLVLILVLVLTSLVSAFTSAALESGKGAGAKEQQIILAPAADVHGLSDPPSTDFSVRYMFTGVINDTGGREATMVHCTNFNVNAVDVGVEVWNTNPTTTYSGTLTLEAGQTRTFSTQNITGFPQDLILAPAPANIFQGSGRVLTKQHTDVICTAQVIDPTNDPPIFVSQLTLFSPNGTSNIFMPAISNH